MSSIFLNFRRLGVKFLYIIFFDIYFWYIFYVRISMSTIGYNFAQ